MWCSYGVGNLHVGFWWGRNKKKLVTIVHGTYAVKVQGPSQELEYLKLAVLPSI